MMKKEELNNTPFEYGSYMSKIMTPTEEQLFLCRFVVLKNWRRPKRDENFEPYYEEITGLQVKATLYYEDPDIPTREARVYINKPENEIITVFEDIPPNMPSFLISRYNKTARKLKTEKRRREASRNFHQQND